MATDKSIRIPNKLYEAIKAEAGNRGCFMVRVISDALADYFKSRKRGK